MSAPAPLAPLLAGRIAGRAEARGRLEGLCAGREGALVQLCAEAGLGKTRLARFCAERAGAGGRLVLEGRAEAGGQGAALALIRDVLRFERRVHPRLPAPADPLAAEFPARLLPELGGAPEPAGLDRGALFEAAARYLRARARGPGCC